MSITTNDISAGARKMARRLHTDDRRRAARFMGPFEPDQLSADVGRILDASRTGLRARVRWPVKPEYDIMLVHSTNRALVRAKVRWVRRVGLFTFDVGLEFWDLNERDLDLLRRALDEDEEDD